MSDEYEVRVELPEDAADLTVAIMKTVVAFYRGGEPSRERVLDVVDALALVAATVIVGCGPELYKHMGDRILENVAKIMKQVPPDEVEPERPAVLQ